MILYQRSRHNMGEKDRESKVRIYPSGMVEIFCGSPDEAALIGAEVAKGLLHNNKARPSLDVQLPLMSEENPKPSEVTTPKQIRPDTSPFFDPSVDQWHPAVQKLERYILTQPDGCKFRYHWMREFIGREITGSWRECMTRSVGTLMTRLVESGIVTKIKAPEG
jgi:hypothetical protein